MNPYKIILADDHILLRKGIKQIIEASDDMKVVGEAGDGLDLLNLLKTVTADMIILDISMPNLRGVEATREIKMTHPEVKILILSMHKKKEYLYHAFSAGANGYLPNDRRHKLKFWASYEATDDLMFSAFLFAQSGRPINSFGSGHPGGTPWYGATYYLQQPDGSFEFTPRGTAGRTDWITQLNLSAIYSFAWGDSANIELRVDVFNLFDSDSADEVYEYPEEQADLYKLPTSYQQPRYLRFGAAIRF